MWKPLEILVTLTSTDYEGVVITDWYSDQSNANDSIKISIRFLSNEIRADALKLMSSVKSVEC